MSKNKDKILPNYVFRPLSYELVYTFIWPLTSFAPQLWGQIIIRLKCSQYLKDIAPTVRNNWAHYQASGHLMDLSDEGHHIYYSFEMDWQTTSRLHLKGGIFLLSQAFT